MSPSLSDVGGSSGASEEHQAPCSGMKVGGHCWAPLTGQARPGARPSHARSHQLSTSSIREATASGWGRDPGPQLGQASTCSRTSGSRASTFHHGQPLWPSVYTEKPFSRGPTDTGYQMPWGRQETWALGGPALAGGHLISRGRALLGCGSRRVSISLSGLGAGWGLGAAGSAASWRRAHWPEAVSGQAAGPACSPGPRAQWRAVSSGAGRAGALSRAARTSKPASAPSGVCASTLGWADAAGSSCPARSWLSKQGARAQGGRHTQADPSIVERGANWDPKTVCQRRRKQRPGSSQPPARGCHVGVWGCTAPASPERELRKTFNSRVPTLTETCLQAARAKMTLCLPA